MRRHAATTAKFAVAYSAPKKLRLPCGSQICIASECFLMDRKLADQVVLNCQRARSSHRLMSNLLDPSIERITFCSPLSSTKLDGLADVSSFGELFNGFIAKCLQIIRSSTRHQALIANDLLIHPSRACVDEIGFQARP